MGPTGGWFGTQIGQNAYVSGGAYHGKITTPKRPAERMLLCDASSFGPGYTELYFRHGGKARLANVMYFDMHIEAHNEEALFRAGIGHKQGTPPAGTQLFKYFWGYPTGNNERGP